jgi:hypothetical protein
LLGKLNKLRNEIAHKGAEGTERLEEDFVKAFLSHNPAFPEPLEHEPDDARLARAALYSRLDMALMGLCHTVAHYLGADLYVQAVMGSVGAPKKTPRPSNG